MQIVVKHRNTGKFLMSNGRWSDAYPDAEVFGDVIAAIKAAKRADHTLDSKTASLIADYGLETERNLSI